MFCQYDLCLLDEEEENVMEIFKNFAKALNNCLKKLKNNFTKGEKLPF